MTTSPANPPIAAIVLAAGEGTRMGTPDVAKVCHEVAPGVPAIRFVVDQLAAAGTSRFAAVTGAHADQVEAALAPVPDVTLAFQAERLGTGHATRVGYDALQSRDLSAIVVAMGDKVMTSETISYILHEHLSREAELTFAVSPRRPDNEQGRVVVDDTGEILAIVELADLVAARATAELHRLFNASDRLNSAVVREVIAHFLPKSGKVPRVLQELWYAAHDQETIASDDLALLAPDASATLQVADRPVSPGWVAAHTPYVNEALYVFSPEALDLTVAALSPDNAQAEFYLTDAVALLRSRAKRVQAVPLAEGDIVGFNTLGELHEVREAVAAWSRA